MKKILFFIFLFQTSLFAQDLEKAYFAGGCFWCMEESFEKKEGVTEVISGYSGGKTNNPTYVSGASAEWRVPSFKGDPHSFVSTIVPSFFAGETSNELAIPIVSIILFIFII